MDDIINYTIEISERYKQIFIMDKTKEKVNRKLKNNMKDGKYSNNRKNRISIISYWGTETLRKAIAIGINPSKANDERSDRTLTMLSRFLDLYGFSQFKMLNLFTTYSTEQSGLDRKDKTVFSEFKNDFENADAIIIAWGVGKEYKKDKETVIKLLEKYKSKVYCIDDRKEETPRTRHPSRIIYNECELANFMF